jgi:hypothetical protein
MTDTTASAGLTGNVLFYSQPEPLSVDLHGKLGANPVDKPYAFVAGTHLIPLTVTEFAPAALSYPVIFVGDNKQPVAVMGLRQEDNLFVSAEGDFRPEAYIPAYIRRYPFVFANDEEQNRMILCIDRGAPFITEGGETPLFDGDQPSAYVQQAMEDLFETRESVFTPRNPDGSAGPQQKIAEYFAISEDKLKALPAEKFAELRDNGALGQIYAHLVSLLGWDRLIAMAFAKAAAQPAAANA